MNTKHIADFYDSSDQSEVITDAALTRASPTVGVPMEAFTVRLPITVLDHFRAQAKREGVTTGEVLRRVLQDASADQVDNDATITVRELRALIANAG